MFKADHKLIYSSNRCIEYYNVFVNVLVILFRVRAMIMYMFEQNSKV